MLSKKQDKHKSEPKSADESRWVQEAVEGNREAFGRLVDVYQDRVYSFSYRLTGQHEKAWDLSQEAFMKAFAAISGFKGKSGFYTWIYRIVLNLHMNREKSLAGRMEKKSYSMDNPIGCEDGPSFAKCISNGPDCEPSAEIERKEREIAVQNAVSKLPADQRQAVLLRDMEGFSYEEMADLLSIPIGTVRSRLHRAREELRRRLEGIV